MKTIVLLESLLFASGSPVSLRLLSSSLGIKEEDVIDLLGELQTKINTDESGIHLIVDGKDAQLVSHPNAAEFIEEIFAKEISGDLTRPQMEVLSIIAYRGPVSKDDIELIRGANATLILRNLMLRDLIQEIINKEQIQTLYQITLTALELLGVHSVKELPEYEVFNKHEELDNLLEISRSEEENV